jgi:hypothetical protein
MTRITTDLDRLLQTVIHGLSERTDDELHALLRSVERAYTHVRIEQALRDTVRRS